MLDQCPYGSVYYVNGVDPPKVGATVRKKGNQDGLDIAIIHLQVNVNSYMYNDATVDKSLAKI